MTTPHMHRAPRILALLAAAGLVWALAGCAPQPALDDATGETLQAGVVEIAQRVDGGDASGALAQLDLFEEELQAAVDDGRISAEREAEVREAISLVRADLEATIAAEEEAAATPEATTEPAPATEADTGSEDSNSGPGNNNGNGNGNGNSGRGNNNGNGGGND
ncbi:hypothetical protein [Agromyces sp. SYSU T00194]|uniref:hypothetical protein n=1 Tax=Agromyces chitinivorans TaxID=3158560 RepID=UPI00339597E5